MRQLYGYGEYDWDALPVKRAEIHAAQQSLPDEASVTPQDGDLEWCRAQPRRLQHWKGDVLLYSGDPESRPFAQLELFTAPVSVVIAS